MYKVLVRIQGISPILQHAFGADDVKNLQQEAKQRTGQVDYSLEWMGTMYAGIDGYLYQPASHLEGALQKAASAFKVKGKAGKTFKDAVKAYAYIAPVQPRLLWNSEPIPTPTKDLLENPTDALQVSVMRVKVQRAAVARSRLMINVGWELEFGIDVIDDQLPQAVVKEALAEAGRAVGIGDFRPRYGRFNVVAFEVSNGA